MRVQNGGGMRHGCTLAAPHPGPETTRPKSQARPGFAPEARPSRLYPLLVVYSRRVFAPQPVLFLVRHLPNCIFTKRTKDAKDFTISALVLGSVCAPRLPVTPPSSPRRRCAPKIDIQHSRVELTGTISLPPLLRIKDGAKSSSLSRPLRTPLLPTTPRLIWLSSACFSPGTPACPAFT